MKGLAVIVLAAGLGTRMRSGVVKVLHPVAGRPMLLHTLDHLRALKPESIVAVLGHQAEEVSKVLPEGVLTARQKEQLGTAHAALCGMKKLKGFTGTVMVVSGDTPLLDTETYRSVVSRHRKSKADVTVLTAVLEDPAGYGRIIRDGGNVGRIVEQKDATEAERAVREINTGAYCFQTDALNKALKLVGSENAQGEFYLTDVVHITAASGGKVTGVPAPRPEEALGINSRVELAMAESMLRKRTNERLMASGVTIIDPAATYIEPGVVVGRDTVIHPGNHITGNSIIGERCVLMPGNVITDSTVKDGSTILGYSVISRACVDEYASVGPFAHIRPGSRLEAGAKAGNFVELKKALLGAGSKASHLSYLGDAIIGRDVNIGAGTITCNYDGVNKHQTVIGDGVFVGSDTQFIAPVRVGRGALIAAGTTVTRDVPEDALAISRTKQSVTLGWACRKREQLARTKKK
ncbi:MAG TPA: bifunctional UDP-N-acetylglucosamine diphosphorylase/glucosamine-1-phosphate N-acetyltransferase GlmU [Nitrospirota bacterium]